MYHVELRQFPHNFCRFNLTETELRGTILDAWARGEWIELGERKWSPHQASLTVIEAPRLPMEQLSMGRGWSNAKRLGRDVTADLLREAKALPGVQGAGRRPSSASSPAQTEGEPPAGPLVSDLLAMLGEDPVSLVTAWRLALERHPDRTPSECLALAEDLLRR
jgi:hypothetical protein